MVEKTKDTRLRLFKGPGVNITAISACGTKVKTKEYGELIDFQSGCWAAVLGHQRKEIAQTLLEGIDRFMHIHQFMDTGCPEALVNELTIAARIQGGYKGTFLSSGSEAVSLAVLLAEEVTGRALKLSFSLSFLGSTPDLRLPRNPAQWLDLDIQNCLHCPKTSSCKDCGRFSEIDFHRIAAFVFEPGNSCGLVLCPPDKLITYLVQEVRQAKGLVIANEVTTGFGRTGKWFGFQHYEAFQAEQGAPELIALGKGLGNGYPVSGVLLRSDYASIVEASGFRHVQSHTDDPSGCIVARKVIDLMSRDRLVEHGRRMGDYLRTKLHELGERNAAFEEVRGRGMMNVAILHPRYSAKDVFIRLLQMGFFVGYSEVHHSLQFYGPLTIVTDEIDALCNALGRILDEGL